MYDLERDPDEVGNLVGAARRPAVRAGATSGRSAELEERLRARGSTAAGRAPGSAARCSPLLYSRPWPCPARARPATLNTVRFARRPLETLLALAAALRRRVHGPVPRLRHRRLRRRARTRSASMFTGDQSDLHAGEANAPLVGGARRPLGARPRRPRAPAPATAAAAAVPGARRCSAMRAGDPRGRRGRGRPLGAGRGVRDARADARA